MVTPLSGPLARYGRAGATALALWAQREAVRLTVHDAHPDPVAAIHRAEADRPELIFGPYGSGPTRRVAAATSRLLFNHGGARAGTAGNVVSVLAAASSYLVGALEAVRRADRDLRRVSVAHGDTGFGRAVADGAAAAAGELGVLVERAVLPDDPPGADLLLVAGGFRDELASARRLLPGQWRAAAFVGAGVEEVLAPLGAGREGLLGPAQWLPSAVPQPDEGPTAAEFVTAYRHRTGEDPPYPAAQAFAAGLIAGRCLREAGSADDGALLVVARRLDITTMFGSFRLDPDTGQQVGHRVLTVQWQDGARHVVWPPGRADAVLRHPLSAASRSTS
ncbi:MAG: ABC transporter substrate-binding protein [Pseudonocardiaceae bacterium]|nr:ABC transporter substrate-binding protein [Pseudonocardiaceae bacterium]